MMGLQKAQLNFHFFTSFWYKPSHILVRIAACLPRSISQKIIFQFKKRSFEPLQSAHIFIFPWVELMREVAEKIIPYHWAEYLLFVRDRIHDRWASWQLNDSYAVVVGYEECSLHTFRKAKKLNKTVVLDLAQIHHKEIENIATTFPVFGQIYVNKRLRKKINRIKAEELQLADYVLCLSEFAKQSLLKNGVDVSKIVVTHLGFDPKKFFAKNSYSISTSSPLKLVYAGTLTKRKGIDLLFRLLDDMQGKVQLSVIGNVSDASELVEKYKDKFTWYPYLKQEEMNKVFCDHDLFVFPTYLDSWAMVVVEAMACGLPVIITENTGAKDVLSKGGGLILKTGNYELLQESIKKIYDNRAFLKSEGCKAHEQAQFFTWVRYYNQIGNIFLNL